MDNVRIEISRDGNWTNGDGSDVDEVVASTSDTGTYAWLVSGPPTTTALLRVLDAANTAFTDVMGGSFVIKGFSAVGGLSGIDSESIAIGDYDSDKDLDFIVAGWSSNELSEATRIIRNDNGVYTEIDPDVEDVDSVKLSWGDYDNDGDIDLVLSGWNGTFDVAYLYKNSSGSLIDSGATFLMQEVSDHLLWVDYNNDGRLDLNQIGSDNYLFRNEGTTDFISETTNIGLCRQAEWGDMNQDAMSDFVIGYYPAKFRIYYNNGTTNFTISDPCPIATLYECMRLGDYDADGDLDVVGFENTSSGRIIRNNGDGTYTVISDPNNCQWSSCDWGDFDNDGDLDFMVTGEKTAGTNWSRLFRNEGSDTFTPLDMGNIAVQANGEPDSLKFADFNKDGYLDFVLSGEDESGNNVLEIYINDGFGPANTAPSAPTSFSTSVSGSGPYTVTFQWNDGSDSITPAKGLSYNLRVGTTSGGNQVMSGMAAADGTRYLTGRGPIQPSKTGNNKWFLKDLPAGTYYWAVQSIDGGYMSSAWSTEQTLVIP